MKGAIKFVLAVIVVALLFIGYDYLKKKPLPPDNSAKSATRTVALDNTAPTWTDPATGLMWAGQDNGSDVTWNEASNYCSNLRLAGYSNWRLATNDELAGIYDETQNVNGWHTKGGIKLSGCCSWSGSAGTGLTENSYFNFTFLHGRGFDTPFDYANGLALCVRRSGE